MTLAAPLPAGHSQPCFNFVFYLIFHVYLIVKYLNISHKINAIDTAFQVVTVGLTPLGTEAIQERHL